MFLLQSSIQKTRNNRKQFGPIGIQGMNLQEVCERLLDNADMRIDLRAFPKVTLDILVQGTVNGKFWKVVFDCGQVIHMDAELDDDSSSGERYMILEASVNEIKKGSNSGPAT